MTMESPLYWNMMEYLWSQICDITDIDATPPQIFHCIAMKCRVNSSGASNGSIPGWFFGDLMRSPSRKMGPWELHLVSVAKPRRALVVPPKSLASAIWNVPLRCNGSPCSPLFVWLNYNTSAWKGRTFGVFPLILSIISIFCSRPVTSSSHSPRLSRVYLIKNIPIIPYTTRFDNWITIFDGYQLSKPSPTSELAIAGSQDMPKSSCQKWTDPSYHSSGYEVSLGTTSCSQPAGKIQWTFSYPPRFFLVQTPEKCLSLVLPPPLQCPF